MSEQSTSGEWSTPTEWSVVVNDQIWYEDGTECRMPMYVVRDRDGREVCVAPDENTARLIASAPVLRREADELKVQLESLRRDNQMLEQINGQVNHDLGCSEADNQRLRGLLEGADVEVMHIDENGVEIQHWAIRWLAVSFAKSMKESRAPNYFTIEVNAPDPIDVGPLLVTIQRKDGKTPHDYRRAAEVERDAARADAERFRKAIATHRDQRGDDRCWLDDQNLYAIIGEVATDNAMPPKDKFLANCSRYYDARCRDANWPSYQELEAEVASLREQIERMKAEHAQAEEQWKAEWHDAGDYDLLRSYLAGEEVVESGPLGGPVTAAVVARIKELQKIIDGFAARIHAQSELLSKRAETTPLRRLVEWDGGETFNGGLRNFELQRAWVVLKEEFDSGIPTLGINVFAYPTGLMEEAHMDVGPSFAAGTDEKPADVVGMLRFALDKWRELYGKGGA